MRRLLGFFILQYFTGSSMMIHLSREGGHCASQYIHIYIVLFCSAFCPGSCSFSPDLPLLFCQVSHSQEGLKVKGVICSVQLEFQHMLAPSPIHPTIKVPYR